MKTRAASNNLETLKELITQFFYGSSKELKQLNKYTWAIIRPDGTTMDSYIVKLSRGRYYFKEIQR